MPCRRIGPTPSSMHFASSFKPPVRKRYAAYLLAMRGIPSFSVSVLTALILLMTNPLVHAASLPAHTLEARILISAESATRPHPRDDKAGLIKLSMTKRIINSAERVTRPHPASARRALPLDARDRSLHRRQTSFKGANNNVTVPGDSAVTQQDLPLMWNDIMYVIDFTIGNEGPFPLQVDTGSSNTWVAGKDCEKCNQAQMKTVQDFQVGSDCWDLAYGLGKTSVCFGVKDIGFGGFTVSNYSLLSAYSIDDHFSNFPYCSGIFGVGMTALALEGNPTIIDVLVESKAMAQPEIGFYLPPVGQSELTLGGADPDRWDEASSVSLPNVEPTKGFYKVKLDDVVINGTTFGFGTRDVILDSGSTYNNGPAKDLLAIFTALLGYEPYYWQDTAATQQVCLLPCNAPPGQEWPITFRFGGKDFPMHWTSLVSEPFISRPGLCYAAATGSMAQNARWILGDRFLHNVYHTVNTKTGEVRMSKLKSTA